MQLHDSPTDTRLPYWVTIVLALVTGFALGFLANGPEPATDDPVTPIRCATEDEIPAAITQDAYDYEEGTPLCVHIDMLTDQVG